jgi:hypothetical protein
MPHILILRCGHSSEARTACARLALASLPLCLCLFVFAVILSAAKDPETPNPPQPFEPFCQQISPHHPSRTKAAQSCITKIKSNSVAYFQPPCKGASSDRDYRTFHRHPTVKTPSPPTAFPNSPPQKPSQISKNQRHTPVPFFPRKPSQLIASIPAPIET